MRPTSKRTAQPKTVAERGETSDCVDKRRHERGTACFQGYHWPFDPLFVTVCQVRDYTGAMALLSGLPAVDWILADRGYDAEWFRKSLVEKCTKPHMLGCKSRKKVVKYDKCR